MKSDRYLLDLEGNIYIFNDEFLLEDYIFKDSVSDKDVPYTDTEIILYDGQNMYKMPSHKAINHIGGKRKISEILDYISDRSLREIVIEELSALSPVIYKIYEEELLLLCEKEGDDVSLYQISSLMNNYTRPDTMFNACRNAFNNMSNINNLRNSMEGIMQSGGASPFTQSDMFVPSGQNSDDMALFSNIRNLSRSFASQNFSSAGTGGSVQGGSYSFYQNPLENSEETSETEEAEEDTSTEEGESVDAESEESSDSAGEISEESD